VAPAEVCGVRLDAVRSEARLDDRESPKLRSTMTGATRASYVVPQPDVTRSRSALGSLLYGSETAIGVLWMLGELAVVATRPRELLSDPHWAPLIEDIEKRGWYVPLSHDGFRLDRKKGCLHRSSHDRAQPSRTWRGHRGAFAKFQRVGGSALVEIQGMSDR